MNTYTYEILHLITSDLDPQRPNDVTRVLAGITGTDTSGRSQLLNCMFDLVKTEAEFIPYDQLTEELVRQWVDALEDQWSNFKSQIDTFLNESVGIKEYDVQVPPWIPTPEELTAEAMANYVSEETSSSNTTTYVGMPSMPITVSGNVSEEEIKALIYKVLEEINSGTV